ncbi:lipopolysaccharide biosynthesis protein [Hymenobacter koreensis]|uniref:Polysaccharide biosynthesis protein C-terminal domain-containing protein n=1 Tax=Hymenobacter koreensis TaxID=1084523 RepID=A0ABP8IZT8_9BACT
MLRRLVHTFTARLGIALLNFVVVLITARFLGAAGRGQVSLFVTDIALLLLFIGLLGGSSLIYLGARRNLWHLLVPAATWATVVCLLGSAGIWIWRHPSPTYMAHLLAIAWLQAGFSITTALLLSRRKEQTFNLLNIAQAGLLAGGLWLVLTVLNERTVAAYWWVCYPAYGFPLLVSAALLLQTPDRLARGLGWRAAARELARHSRSAHFSNILSFLNYRVSYYFLAAWAGPEAVGVLSVGTALAEAIWLIPRSAAQVQYLDLVHATDKQAEALATTRTARLALLATGAAVLVLVALPAKILAGIFGPEFDAARPIILLLAPGTLAISLTMLVSSYFAGLARYRINNLAQTVGLAVTLAACGLLIPRYGAPGAALATTLSYLASTGYLLWQFRRASGLGLRQFVPRWREAINWRQLLGK